MSAIDVVWLQNLWEIYMKYYRKLLRTENKNKGN